MRSLASGKAVTQFGVATNEYLGQGKEKAAYQMREKGLSGYPAARREITGARAVSAYAVDR
jgi:hypothetical protein